MLIFKNQNKQWSDILLWLVLVTLPTLWQGFRFSNEIYYPLFTAGANLIILFFSFVWIKEGTLLALNCQKFLFVGALIM